jgi:hypothetical protein
VRWTRIGSCDANANASADENENASATDVDAGVYDVHVDAGCSPTGKQLDAWLPLDTDHTGHQL